MIEWLVEVDKSLFLFLNGLHCRVCDTIMWWFSNKFFWIPLYFAVLVWWIKEFKWQSITVIVFAILLIIASDQISLALKIATERFRPSRNPEFEGLVHILNNYRGGKFGFVSGHAANSFGFAVFSLLIIQKQWYTIAILIWAAAVSYSRIYLGVHYPADITGGAVLGTTLAFIACFMTNLVRKHIPLSKSNP